MSTRSLEARAHAGTAAPVVSLPPEADSVDRAYHNEILGQRGGGFTERAPSKPRRTRRFGFRPPSFQDSLKDSPTTLTPEERKNFR